MLKEIVLTLIELGGIINIEICFLISFESIDSQISQVEYFNLKIAKTIFLTLCH